MKKIVCDICNNNPADNRFKVKMEKLVHSGFLRYEYVPVDICKECYDKLFKVAKDKNNGCPYYVKLAYGDDNIPPKYICYGTREMEECSCRGDRNKCTFY